MGSWYALSLDMVAKSHAQAVRLALLLARLGWKLLAVSFSMAGPTCEGQLRAGIKREALCLFRNGLLLVSGV